MKISDACKSAGLDSLAELVRISGVSKNTLINWYRSTSKRKCFDVMLAGAVAIKRELT